MCKLLSVFALLLRPGRKHGAKQSPQTLNTSKVGLQLRFRGNNYTCYAALGKTVLEKLGTLPLLPVLGMIGVQYYIMEGIEGCTCSVERHYE